VSGHNAARELGWLAIAGCAHATVALALTACERGPADAGTKATAGSEALPSNANAPAAPHLSPREECDLLAHEINGTLESLRSCATDADCKFTGLNCPFGCFAAVNRTADLQPVFRRMDYYNRICAACRPRCPSIDDEPGCEQGKCRQPHLSAGWAH
jgi:hypothetical protein